MCKTLKERDVKFTFSDYISHLNEKKKEFVLKNGELEHEVSLSTKEIGTLTNYTTHRNVEYVPTSSSSHEDIECDLNAKEWKVSNRCSSYEGVECEDLLRMEEVYNVKIIVFELGKDEGSNVIWLSSKPAKNCKVLNLNLYKDHFSLIRRLDIYAKAFSCPTCDATYTKSSHLIRHKCKPSKASVITFPGGVYKPTPTIFDTILERTGVDVVKRFPELRFYPYRATFDCECYFPADADLPEATPTTEFVASHHLLSISACSNVPGYEVPKCFVRKTSVEDVVKRFVEHLLNVAEEAERRERRRWKPALDLLERVIERRRRVEKE